MARTGSPIEPTWSDKNHIFNYIVYLSISSLLFKAIILLTSFFFLGELCDVSERGTWKSNIAKDTTDPRVEFSFAKVTAYITTTGYR